ncbi:TraX family protein [[Clostridium] dakarense]|uniref:TraX family protein n=1 Tax=Faecalimicrobium dakarense TaxID=1301100 RepID=UPI0004B50983|nr:TraX family protein [[Clostridium] dakarense]
MKKLDGFQLKIIALVLMLMDHLYFAFPTVFPEWFHPLSRIVAPIFAYLMVEGFFHTRNRFKYNLRLCGWALFMEVGNRLLNIILASKEVGTHNNIFMTLALGLTVLNLIELAKKNNGIKKIGLIVATLLLLTLTIFVEGGMAVIPFILITYLFRENMKKTVIGYTVLSLILFKINFMWYGDIKETLNMLMFNSDFLLILAVPFILAYNGERGLNNKFSKYLFYVFYPLHLWGLAVLQFILK